MKNPFDIYASKVKRFNIPLPEFEFYHKSSSEEKVDKKFIGRSKISDRLYTWLTEDQTKSGSYLVTGYRGMGKSSFVGRILNQLCAQTNTITYSIGIILYMIIWGGCLHIITDVTANLVVTFIFAILPSILFLFFFYYYYTIKDWIRKTKFRIQAFYILNRKNKPDSDALHEFPLNDIALIWHSMQYIVKIKDFKKKWKEVWNKEWEEKWLKDWQKINNELYDTNIKNKSFSRICININLGQEVLNEKDVLCLITNGLYIKYRRFIYSPIANFPHWLVKTAVVVITTIILKYLWYNCIFELIIGRSIEIKDNIYSSIVSVMLFIMSYFLYNYISSFFQFSQKRILQKLRFLNERLDASIDNEVGLKAQTNIVSFNLSNKKKYPLANIREIEQELIDILDRMAQPIIHPSFIFVFDELDKIDSSTSEETFPSNTIPEYTNEKNFPGGGTSRKRKENVLKLLANMKLFVSTAKAKFLFISGRELYDAYLADLSDREFAISSVFNGIIYVESFCTSERKEKDIMSNAETYICKQLIPKSFIRLECILQYLDCKKKKNRFEKLDIDLKLYYKYLTNQYCVANSSKCINTLSCPESNNSSMSQNNYYNDIRSCIDKTIILLYHFSVYLYHISNGSPKKMNLYFEKFVKKSILPNDFLIENKHAEKSILHGKEINIKISEQSKFHLSFGYLDQRKIGFIHYISYPVTQAIINANQFGDKLLVSASFLIDHIYKHHNSGFSWRNLEHTPELLEVYRIPEFRGFISSIISYLTQTHLIPITCGLYQFKFRKQFSEEISLASKFSEEIAALFNFTLDESLSVKRHYSEIQHMYHRKLRQEGTDSPHVNAGIHHILADLYMSDEEYTKAIFEYQTAIKIIPFPNNIKENKDPHFSSHMLFLIRNMLKLGLAYEKRKTYESAYVTYNELISRLINFRYLDEKNLGLDYFIVKNISEEWPTHKAILYANIKNPKDQEGNIITKKVSPPITSHIAENVNETTTFYTDGPNIITDFAHQMTIDKNPIIQRLSLLEDVRLVYQALLAKLFVLEKMELGGITHSNLELLESEYVFLHLATNEKDKFLISTDFFRRLGDIMFYKNGLAGQNTDSLFEGLFYWAYNAKTEVLDFCNENNCHYIKDILLNFLSCFKNVDEKDFARYSDDQKLDLESIFAEELNVFKEKYKDNVTQELLLHSGKICDFFYKFKDQTKRLPWFEINQCNLLRQKKWQDGKPLPCYACKYYNRSLRILMQNLFLVDIEKECGDKKCSKTIIILKYLVNGGSAKSLRQNFTIQFAEILECMGNTMLSCATEDDLITKDFFYAFLEDVGSLNIFADQTHQIKEFKLLQLYSKSDESSAKTNKSLTKLERSILYYWEASECFRISSDLKKASGSLKKILRIIQNYLRVKEDRFSDDCSEKIIIGEFLNEIKNRIVKKSLIYLYSHYDYINITEIQKIKWIFSVQMYENISLNRLSLFPDVEEIMLIYYEMIKLCVIHGKINKEMEDNLLKRNDSSWDSITARNIDFRLRLAKVYRNIAFTTVRMESTIYERILSLRYRASLNQEIMHHLVYSCFKDKEKSQNYFPKCKRGGICDREQLCFFRLNYYQTDFIDSFVNFLTIYTNNDFKLSDRLEEYKYCFPHIDFSEDDKKNTFNKYSLIEFLIKDSMYCLTKILETITPYTSTTLFTNTFLGEVHQKLFEWNQLFDALYIIYKTTELKQECNASPQARKTKCDKCKYIETKIKSMNTQEIYKCWTSKCPHYDLSCEYKETPLEYMVDILNRNIVTGHSTINDTSSSENNSSLADSLMKYREYLNENLSHRFFTFILKETGKSNIHYTLNNYSAEMAIKCYRKALELHKEGKAYKEMIAKMYYLDDDLKNDTIQFDSAIERYKINNGYVNAHINNILGSFRTSSLYDIENFSIDNEMKLPPDRFDKFEF